MLPSVEHSVEYKKMKFERRCSERWVADHFSVTMFVDGGLS
jgi:hypothetical protein